MVVRSFNSEEFKESQSIVINEKEIELLEEKFRSEFSTTIETKTSDTSIEIPIFNQEQILALNEQFSKIHPGIIGKEDFKKIVAGIEGKELLHIDQLYNSFAVNKDEGLDYM